MPDLLLELFSEEIPARMQAQAADDLKRLVSEALAERGLAFEGAASFATPRRLAPEAAVQGFLKSAGLGSISEAKIEVDPKKKGEFYVAVIERKGRTTI